MLIMDNWKTGIPFLIVGNGVVYDAFLFYSVSENDAVFHSVKMLVGVNILTGELKEFDVANSSTTERNFSFTPKHFRDVNEYLRLSKQLKETYQALRNALSSATELKTVPCHDQYLALVKRLVPEEILKKIYAALSPDLFR